jgi:hypothetical protein
LGSQNHDIGTIMPKLLCPCGFVHDLSPIPDEGWITIRDQDYEQVIQDEMEREQLPDHKNKSEEQRFDQLTGTIVAKWGRIYDCPQCGRIMWQKEGSKEFVAYSPIKNSSEIGSTTEGVVEILTLTSNAAVVRLPGRQFHGSVIQGDSLSILFHLAKSVVLRLETSTEDELRGEAQELYELIQARLHVYEAALLQHGFDLPYQGPLASD